jgi:hypothetical protein
MSQSITTKVQDVATKKTKTGKDMYVVETDAGRMSSFEYGDVAGLIPLREKW